MSRSVEQLIERARMHLRHGNVAGAIESLRQALSVDADHAGAHALLALCLHDARRLYAAEHEASASLSIDPDLPLAHYAMGVVRLAQRRFRLAEEHLKQASALEPENANFLHSRARLYLLWHRRAEALPLLEKARQLAPDDADSWAALATYYHEERQPERAEKLARRALELDPENVDALLAMGEIRLQQGNTAEAREHALLILRQNADDEAAIRLLASVKARESLLLGLWWRINSFFGTGSIMRRVVALLAMYLAYRVGVLVLGDLGYAGAQLPLSLLWLGFCVYTWVGPTLFQKQLARELEPARLEPKY
jgi:tetratricopeptide (TPR) repeat protein